MCFQLKLKPSSLIEMFKLYIEDNDFDYKSFNGYLSLLIEKNDDFVGNKEIKTFYLNGTNYESNMEVNYQSIDNLVLMLILFEIPTILISFVN